MSGRSFKHAWNFLSDKTNSGKPGKKLTQLRRMGHDSLKTLIELKCSNMRRVSCEILPEIVMTDMRNE